MHSRTRSLHALALTTLLGLAGCGHHGHSGGPAAAPAEPTTVVGGVHAGAVARGTLRAYSVAPASGALRLLGSTTTDDRGGFSLTFTGEAPFLLLATRGSYPDEATGRTLSLGAADPSLLVEARAGTLEALVGSGCGRTLTVYLSPLTTFASHRVAQLARSGGDVLTEPQVLAVNRAVAALVGVRDGSQGFDPRAARPLDFTDPADGAAIRAAPGSSAALLGGVLGGLSRQALDLGLADPMGLVDALARDYEADGHFDGLGTAPLTLAGELLSPEAGGADLRRGNAEFLGDPLRNRSGSLPDDQPTLIDPPGPTGPTGPTGPVEPSNVAPDFVVADATVNEDRKTVLEVTGVTAGTVDEDATQTVTFTASSSDQALVADASLSVAGAGATRSLWIRLRPNANGVATITLVASDGAATTTHAFTLTIDALNDAPTLAPPDAVTGTQNVAAVVSLTGITPGGGLDEAEQAIGLVASAANPSLFASLECSPITSGTSTLTLTPALGAHGATDVTVLAEDAGGGTREVVFGVTLLPPVTLERTAGDGQQGEVGDLLPARLVVTARDANGVAVPSVPVTFVVTQGAGVALVQSSAATDGDGQAGSLVQLGVLPGAVEVELTSSEVQATALFSATAVAGPPATLRLVTAPTSVGLETPFGVSLQLLDRLGNAAVSSSSATIELSTSYPQGALSGTTERAPIVGLVTFDDLQLDAPGDGYALQVSFPGLTPVTVSPLSVTPLPLAWRVREPTFQRAGGAAASASDGTMYLVGGETGSGPLATVHAYDPASDWLTQLETGLSYPRADVAAACAGTRLYVLGGSEELVSLSIVESYAPGPGWRTEDPLPESVYGAAAVAGPDGELYVLGGRQSQEGQGGSLPVGYVQVLDTTSGLWAKLADLTTPRAYAGAAFGPDGRLYVVGGVGANGPLALVEAYDPATGATTAVEPMPRARASCAALTGPDGRIYAIGGSDWTSTFGHSAVDVLSTVTGEWTAGASLTDGRTRFQAAVAADGQLVVVGGQRDADVNTIEVYGPKLEVLYVNGQWLVRGSGFADGAAYEVRAGGPEGELLASGVTSEGSFLLLIQLPNGALWARDAKSLYPVLCRPPG